MPYIKKERRNWAYVKPENAGELNFAISSFIKDYIGFKGKSYQTFNDILGAIEGSKAEFYRRIVVPYEEEKRDLNGDVY